MNDTDTTRDLTELWDAMGDAGRRPGHIVKDAVLQNEFRMLTVDGDWCWPSKQDVSDILTGHAERWLRGRGWNSISPGDVHDVEWEHEPMGTGYISLPAAIRAECGRGK